MKKQGFTLIEMLIVVAIIAILASSFLIGARIFRDRAYDSRRISDLPKIQGYLEIYYTVNRSYPSVTAWESLNNVLSPLINAQIPNDPLSMTGRNYFYCFSEDTQSYILGATLSTADHSVLDDNSEIDNISSYRCEQTSSCDDADAGYCISL